MIKWKNKEVSYIHLSVYKWMKKKAENPLFITHSSVRKLLNRRFYRIPKKGHFILLKEMEELKLIKKLGSKNCIRYKFTGGNADKLLNQYNSIF